jgi:DNA-binding transcriptional LysR family regulator
MPRALEDCEAHDWVFCSAQIPRFRGAPAVPRARTSDLLFACGMVRAGIGIGLLPGFLAQEDIRNGRIVRVIPRWALSAGILFFVHPPAQHASRKVTALRDFMIDLIAHAPLTLPRDGG